MRKYLLGVLALSLSLIPVLPARAERNVLLNPSLLEAVETRAGTEPARWTRRGSLTFSNAMMTEQDSAYEFSLTASDGETFREDCSVEGKLHPGGEAGYFQTYRDVSPGQTWQFALDSKLLTGGGARIFIYAKNASGRNLEVVAELAPNELNSWRRLQVRLTLPDGTDSVFAAFRGRVCEPGE